MIIYHMICTTFNIMMVGWFWQSNLGFISWVNLSIKYKVLLLGFGFQKHHPSPWLLFANYQHTQVTSIGINNTENQRVILFTDYHIFDNKAQIKEALSFVTVPRSQPRTVSLTSLNNSPQGGQVHSLQTPKQ